QKQDPAAEAAPDHDAPPSAPEEPAESVAADEVIEEPETVEEPKPSQEKAPSETPPPAAASEPANTAHPANANHALEKADLRSLMAAIREEDSAVVTTVEAVTLEEVQEAWNTYVAQSDRDSIKVPLQSAQLSVNGLAIQARVATSLAENTIRQENGLMGYLRDQLQAPNLTLSVAIDESLRKDEPIERPKILSPRDKYLMMRESNPAVEELRKRFDLRPDE
ncbi:MAG: DNA polymerase III subunit gamma/tau, partial [Lewinella sp.]|nr:DNA polymerase III subunit gamma/tau [Lewinella sp.]